MFLSAALAVTAAFAQPPAKFEIQDGDRIVWIGNTLVEREQRYGYWETALHAAFPDKQFTLRNLGWSGDTVFGEARGRFDFNNPDFCFKQLVGLTMELKPTVIFVSYGTNESFEGEAGLPKFEKGLEKLLDALKPSKARVVLFTPAPVSLAMFGGDDPRRANNEMYSKAIRKVARSRSLLCVNTQSAVGVDTFGPKTTEVYENGMHLTAKGYEVSAGCLVATLRGETECNSPDWTKYEQLRQAIIAKNELFFHRWRPQNETYLFGFRKHEQGKNAKEVAEFDPLVAKAEEEIETIRKKLKD